MFIPGDIWLFSLWNKAGEAYSATMGPVDLCDLLEEGIRFGWNEGISVTVFSV